MTTSPDFARWGEVVGMGGKLNRLALFFERLRHLCRGLSIFEPSGSIYSFAVVGGADGGALKTFC